MMMIGCRIIWHVRSELAWSEDRPDDLNAMLSEVCIREWLTLSYITLGMTVILWEYFGNDCALCSETPYVLLSVVIKLVSGATRDSNVLHSIAVPVVRQILLAWLLVRWPMCIAASSCGCRSQGWSPLWDATLSSGQHVNSHSKDYASNPITHKSK